MIVCFVDIVGIVCFVDIVGIVDNDSLNFLFIIY
jgi:hypothetical protein